MISLLVKIVGIGIYIYVMSIALEVICSNKYAERHFNSICKLVNNIGSVILSDVWTDNEVCELINRNAGQIRLSQ